MAKVKADKPKSGDAKGASKAKKESCRDTFLRKALELKWLIVFFVPFLFFQINHIILAHWDTTAYIMNGKWFCGQQMYFEFIRPPLPAFLNCLSGATAFSMVTTTIFASLLYFAAIALIYLKFKKELNQPIFALFAFLFPPIIYNANFGSDLLALAFILLAFASKSPLKKGFLASLASLSRYNFLIFAPLLIYEIKKARPIGKFLLAFALPWIPWMLYNFLFTGNPFFTIQETIFLNVQQKGIAAPIGMEQIFIIGVFAIFLMAAGIRRSMSIRLNQAGIIDAIMFFVSGIKETRFINLLTPLIAFNAAKVAKKGLCFAIPILLLFLLCFYFYPKPGYSELNVPGDSFIKDCRVASDKWVFFYPKGIVAEVVYDLRSWDTFIQDGGAIVLYDYKLYDLNKFSSDTIINRGDYVIIKSDKCAPQPKKYISGSMRNTVYRWLRDTNSKIYDYSDWVDYYP
jgi:hypothetical protein